ncbi:conserved hypothetical protein [Leishmania major strain Friedlin]|uniref:C2H2-type domain-containing protein n=1 Tax=Leishmania major TaxID=5664 RepID=E9AC71_LEIMA|nr:conserved hypothetical protein [Leishmania major strain Friedlin]CAG9567146.1 hypothetical_protein_-_conserved [Leishmania major strain Friedlin]CBZ11885.1 conserved hypothetical protein [Leishmania major strain Friedlin]|eukprot:XP_003721602.1 conserved hypothetical protein [Leishmania major strain Friedlin]
MHPPPPFFLRASYILQNIHLSRHPDLLMSRAASIPSAAVRWCLALAPPLPTASSVSLRSAAAVVESHRHDRPRLAPVAVLSAIALTNSRRLSAAPHSLPFLYRRPSGLRACCTSGNGCRSIRLAAPSPASAGAAAASASVTTPTPSAPAPAQRERHVCPECGKRFLCEPNLVRHRATRHGVQVASATEVARAQIAARNARLQQELARVQARVRQLRDGGGTAATAVLAVDAASAYPSAVLTGRLMQVDEAVERAWRHSGRGLGTGISFVSCVGTVRGPVEVGTLRGATPASASDSPAAGPRVLQFVLEAHGYRERRPGQLKMYRSHLLVRYVAWQPYHCYGDDDGAGSAAAPCPPATAPLLFKVQEGDLLRVQGHYALHSSYDMISKQSVENVVLEADAVGMLRPAPAKETSAAQRERDGSPTRQPFLSTSPPSRHATTPTAKDAISSAHDRCPGQDSAMSAAPCATAAAVASADDASPPKQRQSILSTRKKTASTKLSTTAPLQHQPR